ncbi:MAG: hypothetical protein QXG39_08065 [Candidatus Aenigmatarchaeota archaeon]
MIDYSSSNHKTTFVIPEVSAETVMEALEGICIAGSKGLTLREVCNYIGKSEEYARRCINVAIQLKMIKELGDKYVAESESGDILLIKKEEWPVLFKKFLQRYEPFILFVSLIIKGNSVEDSCRKIKTIYGIPSNIKKIKKSFLAWGRYANLLEINRDGTIKLKFSTETTTPEYISALNDALENDIKIRLYIENKLGDEVFGFLQHDEVEFLVKGIKTHKNNPRGAIEDAGKAFEDFLRRIGACKRVDMSSSNGIGQCAQTLRREDIITQKHLHMCEYINALRLIAAHSKEKTTLKSWKINPDAAIEAILNILTLIRSIFLFVFKGDYTV